MGKWNEKKNLFRFFVCSRCHNAVVVVVAAVAVDVGFLLGGVTMILGWILSTFRLLLPMSRRHGSPNSFAFVATQEDVFERLSKYFVEYGVENWVDHRRSIAQPRNEIKHALANVRFAIGANSWQQIEDEKRRPQKNECEKHHSENLRSLLLQTNDATVSWWVAWNDARITWVMRPNCGGPLKNARRRGHFLWCNILLVASDDIIVVAKGYGAPQRRRTNERGFMWRWRERRSYWATHTRAASLIASRVPRNNGVAFRVTVLCVFCRCALSHRQAARRRRVRNCVARIRYKLVWIVEKVFLGCKKIARGCCDDFHLDGFHHSTGLIAEVWTRAWRRQLQRRRIALALLMLLFLPPHLIDFVDVIIIRTTFVTFQCLYAVWSPQSHRWWISVVEHTQGSSSFCRLHQQRRRGFLSAVPRTEMERGGRNEIY